MHQIFHAQTLDPLLICRVLNNQYHTFIIVRRSSSSFRVLTKVLRPGPRQRRRPRLRLRLRRRGYLFEFPQSLVDKFKLLRMNFTEKSSEQTWPLGATVWDCERLRCNLCGEVYTAKAPEGVGDKKYDETATSMVGLLKYGCGMPFNRIEKLQAGMGIPLPATTQCELVKAHCA